MDAVRGLALSFSFLFLTHFVKAQIITTWAGNGVGAYAGDGGPALSASISEPEGIAFDDTGNVYIADEGDNVIRKVNSIGIITTVAGNGLIGYTGDGGQATQARLNAPTTIAFDKLGNMYISDTYNHVIRRVTQTGIISTFAGNGFGGYAGDGGQASLASLNSPECVALDDTGNVYIADAGNNRIRKVNTLGVISTFAGTGTNGYGGDGGPAPAAKLSYPNAVLIDTLLHLVYVSDNFNHRVRVIDQLGIINTKAGTGIAGHTGDGGVCNAAQLNQPHGLALDVAGDLYIADEGNSVIRKITAASIISTYVGKGTPAYSGDGGPAILAGLSNAPALGVDAAHNLYIGDYANARVRKVSYCASPIALTITGADTICLGDSAMIVVNSASTYTWSTGDLKDTIVVKPVNDSIFWVAGVSSQCADVDSFAIVVHSCSTGMDGREMVYGFYPNPTKEQITIHVNSPGNEMYHLIDARGVKMISGQINAGETVLSLESLPPGVYLLRIGRYWRKTLIKE